jgi:predicted RNase H-related nuclease YkuK (DUF458 family)
MEAIKKLTFNKVDGTVIENVEQYVKDWTKINPYGKVIIGADSQVHGRRIKFTVAVVMHYIDKWGTGGGAHVIIADAWEKRSTRFPLDELAAKLWREAEYTLIAAQMVDGSDEYFRKRITLHLDFSPETKDKSNIMFSSGLGLLTSMGYKAEGKPFAYVASHTADAFCR